MKNSFSNEEGSKIVYDLIKTIQENKQYLSDIDGAIGDGDHGINMNKGFTMCEEKLEKKSGNLTYCLNVLSQTLFEDIGGSMGPLYGVFFKSMADICDGKDAIDGKLFGDMIQESEDGIEDIGGAKIGDKTLMDTIIPAVKAFKDAISAGKSFADAVEDMKQAAIKGRNSTKDMVAKLGRASRLGERSRGYIDAGSASCCLIFGSMADSIKQLLS